MKVSKVTRDWLLKILSGPKVVPIGLVEMQRYFRNNGPISFEPKQEDGEIVAVSQNFRYGSIITSGKTEEELDRNIKDAILTSFEIPSAYAKEAGIVRQGKESRQYAAA